MLNTFFFGYLSLKWKRLVRTLILIPIIIGIIGFTYFKVKGLTRSVEWISWTLIIIVSTIIISYVLKPFVVKEK